MGMPIAKTRIKESSEMVKLDGNRWAMTFTTGSR